jgi:hypothetical protein
VFFWDAPVRSLEMGGNEENAPREKKREEEEN